jgi:NADH-quinone oxidoreductase subunit L
MKDMGGLRKKMPITHWTFLISCAAIAGVPFLSGFYSKEAVLTQALAFGIAKGSVMSYLPFVLGIMTAGLTAFYMFRVVFKTFYGEPKDHHKYDHAHESPLSMTIPLMVLAALAVTAGGIMGYSDKWFEQRIATEVVFDGYLGIEKTLGAAAEHFEHAHHAAHLPTLGLSILMAAGGIFFSWLVFNGPLRTRDLVGQRGFLASYRRVLENLYYVDAFYNKVVVGSVMALRLVLAFFDKWVVDGLVNLTAGVTKVISAICGLIDFNGVDGAVRATGAGVLRAGKNLRDIQTGRLHDYLFASVILIAVMFASVALFL